MNRMREMQRVVIAVAAWAALLGTGASLRAAENDKAYLGRWDLTLKAPEREYPSWVELKEENGELKNGTLTFVSPKQEEGLKEDMVFTGRLVGNMLRGTVNGTNGQKWSWTGVRAPALKPPANPKWGKPIQLFDGKSLAGWRMMPPDKKPAWMVKDGVLVKEANGPELVNERKFKDFKLHV